ncbi:MAG: ABC transporter substrate-binding protein [Halanaeroarchaeum sp.]
MTKDNSTDPSISRRKLLGATAGGAISAMLAGCSGGNGSDGTTTSGDGGGGTTTSQWATDAPLEVLHAWTGGDGALAVEKLTSMFKEQYPEVPTDFKPIGGTGNVNLNSVIARRLANDNPPSSFQAWPGENLKQYEGTLTSVTSVWEEQGYVDTMNQTAAELAKQNGEYRSMPLGSHRMNNLFYNISVLESAGVDPASIDSPSALVDALDTIGTETDAVPMAQAMKAPWTNLQLWVEVMLGQEGYQAYMDWTKGNGDKAKVASALETTKTMLKNYINEDAATISFTQANDKVMNGNAGVIHQGNWVYGMYRSSDSFNYQEDWGWVAFPGTEDMYTLHIDAFTFPANNPTPEKKDVWAKFLGQKDAQVAFNNRKGSVPLRMDVDGTKLTDFLQMTWKDLTSKPKQPPTLAHGLAVPPEQLGKAKSAIGNNFMGPFDVDATAQALMDAVSQ